MAKEKRFENKVKKYLNLIGAWYIKYWAGSGYTKKGIPDILASINGTFYGIEVKGVDGKPSLLQLVNLERIRKSEGMGILLYPDDFENFKILTQSKNKTNWYFENIKFQNQWYKKLS